MRAAALLVAALSLAALVACGGAPAPAGPGVPAPLGAPLPPGGTGVSPDGVRADWVVRENARPGTGIPKSDGDCRCCK